MADGKTHTITLKGQGMGDPWLVLGAENVDALENAVLGAFPELDPTIPLAEMIWRAQAAWRATGNLVTGLSAPAEAPQAPQNVPVQRQAPAQESYGGTEPPAPSCQHGQRVFRQSKPGAAKQWKAWMCPAPQGTVDQCAPQWIK